MVERLFGSLRVMLLAAGRLPLATRGLNVVGGESKSWSAGGAGLSRSGALRDRTSEQDARPVGLPEQRLR